MKRWLKNEKSKSEYPSVKQVLPSFSNLTEEIKQVRSHVIYGYVTSLIGLIAEVKGINQAIAIGSQCIIHSRLNTKIRAEVVGFREKNILVMPYGTTQGIGPRCRVEILHMSFVIRPSPYWLGRTINALGEPIDQKGPLPCDAYPILVNRPPPPAYLRRRVGERLDLGVRAINTFTTCCKGQRMGIFSGSGVGKSNLLSMLARFSEADVVIIGFIGERGREVKEFIEDLLGKEGMKKSLIVAATSDEPPLLRRQAAYLTMTLAEYFADLGNDVLCLIDSVTRFAMAQREIGLSVGEPPSNKGYTPSVFAELPKILERAGPRPGPGCITGLFTVLVEGDDENEPISDAVRGILDGHIVLDRAIAERGRYPAINILKSISRTMPDCHDTFEQKVIRKARKYLATHADMEEMIRLGAYQKGSNQEVDQAIHYMPMLEAFLSQEKHKATSIDESFNQLERIFTESPYDAQVQKDNDEETNEV